MMEKQVVTAHESPAAEAANLLLRLGFALLVLVVPVVTLFSRRAFVILVPIGALIIVLAAVLQDSEALKSRLVEALRSPIGAAVGLLALWGVLSLLWTPFPGAASEKMFRNIGIGLMTLLVVSSLPARMRASNLHLMVIGLSVAVLLLIVASLVAPMGLRLVDPDGPTLTRTAAAVGLLLWPAVAWSQIRGRYRQALALIGASGLAIAASGSIEATLIWALALAVFLASHRFARAIGDGLALASGGLLLLAPLLVFPLRMLVSSLDLRADNVLAETSRWADVIAAEPLRLLTGHGADTALRARVSGMIEVGTSGGLISDIWFEFGILGALALALILALSFRAVARLAQPMAASTLAALVAALLYSTIDSSSFQIWWLNVLAILAVMLVAVRNGQYRTHRPAAAIRHEESGDRPKL